MDMEEVIEFLDNVPLLQTLPRSSLLKIAEHVNAKRFEKGDYVVREGGAGDGIFFIWEGEAEVTDSVNRRIDSRSEYQLKRFDYFGNARLSPSQPADIIALSKLTCLILAQEYCELLKPKSIWNADRCEGTALIEKILHLKPLNDNIFQGITVPEAPRYGRIFGGQIMGQALAAATKTVDCLKLVHSLHAYFLLVGDVDLPIMYEVYQVRDGKSFATRKVDAIQKGNVIFSLLASFQKEEKGFEHQDAIMPTVPEPETLLLLEELRQRYIIDPRFPIANRNKAALFDYIPWPMDIKICEPKDRTTDQTKGPSIFRYWFKSKGKLSDDPALHMCVVAYASDMMLTSVSTIPHKKKGLTITQTSLDHSMWFHRQFRADEWILYSMTSPTAINARGLCIGQMFNRKGELIVSLIQEGLIRRPTIPKTIRSTSSKL
ncbi:acyl-CoA hydrolase 2-like [Impatiens glandulifera]|uniref:acyl-CoA hydrolase 2-like n=1 Tax=Impatiens glandulifera TaxID=253017 RepID=UPI001FB19FE1|nr:acyl-CoA hydrolase 2-like [Impatiens glandulifera]